MWASSWSLLNDSKLDIGFERTGASLLAAALDRYPGTLPMEVARFGLLGFGIDEITNPSVLAEEHQNLGHSPGKQSDSGFFSWLLFSS
jgi:hypothetical protein